jgi:hypothetical protein
MLFSAKRKVPPFYPLFPAFPTCQNALESLGRAGAAYPARLFLLGSVIASHGRYVTASRRETSFCPEKEVVAMERMLTAFWDDDRQQVQVRRPTGQVFRFSARQAVAGGHEVFGVQTDGNDVWVLTGAAGSRRPTWKVRYTQTGTYRGTSAL